MIRTMLVLIALLGAARIEAADIPRVDVEGAEQPVIERLNSALAGVESAPGDAEAWGRYAKVLHAHNCRPEADAAYAEAQRLAPDDFRWTYFRGVSLLKTDSVAAVQQLERAVEIDGEYGPAYIRLAIALEDVGRDDDARRALDQALRLEPNNVSAHIHMGQIELKAGHVEKAIRHLEGARKARPADAAVLSALARAYARQGDRALARELAAAARENEPGRLVDDPRFSEVVNEAVTLQAYLDRASVHSRDGKIRLALRELGKALRVGHDPGIVHAQLAREYVQLRDFPKAVESCRAAMAAGRDTAEIHIVLGLALMYDGQLDEAERAARAALSRAPSNAQALWLDGQVAAERGDDVEAVARWDRALVMGDDRKIRIDRAAALSRLGKHDTAIEALEAVSIAAPHDPAVWLALGEARAHAGDLDGAVADYDRALERATAPVAGRQAVAVLIGQGRFAEAETRLRQLRARWPRNANLRNDLAWLLATCPDEQVRDGAEAVILIEPLVRQTSRREPGLLDTLAAALAESGRWADAVAVMDEAVALLSEQEPEARRAAFLARRERYAREEAWRDGS